MKLSEKNFTLAEVNLSRGKYELLGELSQRKQEEFLAETNAAVLMRGAVCEGFTLAEVLITLGIIGVVAAMTLPALISNANSQKFKSQYKKTLSTLNQAINMNIALEDQNVSAVGIRDILQRQLVGYSLKEYIFDYNFYTSGVTLNYDSVLNKGASLMSSATAFILADGSMFAYDTNPGDPTCTLPLGQRLYDNIISANSTTKNCISFIDVNGAALPNKEVSCTIAEKNGIVGSTDGCIVDNKTMGDIFPVVYHDGVVEPASTAAQYVLTTAK